MITREQVQDLRPGDVVELRLTSGATIRGPLKDEWGYLGIDGAGWNVRDTDGSPAFHIEDRVEGISVVSRAPRPLYVNHPRTEPVVGDVVRDADDENSVVSWSRAVGAVGTHGWRYTGSSGHWNSSMPTRLRLLVDGETGQVVAPGTAA